MKAKSVILIVDDQIQNVELLEAYLLPHDYEIVKAESGEEALKKLSGNRIDLILLDVLMPTMDGFEVTRKIRQDDTLRMLPIILVTILWETEDRVRGIEAGCDDFLSKPVDKIELLARVRSLLKVKAYNDMMSNYRNEMESEVNKKTSELKLAVDNLKQDIAERKQMDEALRKSEADFKEAQRVGKLGSWDWDAVTDTITWSEEYYRIYGFDPTQRPPGYEEHLKVYTPESAARLDAAVKKSMESGIPYELDLEMTHSDGSRKWITTRCEIKSTADGKIVGLRGTAQDITERKHTEESLRKYEARFRQTLDTMLEGCMFIGFDWTYLYVNETAAQHGHDTRENIIGRTMLEKYPGVEKTEIFSAYRRCMEERIPQHLESSFTFPDGSTNWYEFSITPVTEGIFVLSLDITERKRVEQELIRLRLGIERSSDAIFITDPYGVIQYINPAFERIYGYTSNEACGKTPRVLKSGKLTLLEYKKFWDTLLSKNVVNAEIVNKTKDGRLISVEVSNNPILDEHDNIIGFMGIHRDITLRLQSEGKEKILESQLQQAQKLESIGTLASGIAHDFNNILGIILGHSTLLPIIQKDPQKLSQSIEAITKATQRGASLVKQLLTFARKADVLFETVYVNDIITEISKLLQETIHKTIVISVTLQQEVPAIIADASQIHQVLLNLCVNARDAMPNGGTLSISSGTIEGKAIQEQFENATARQYVRIEVADTGIGMNETTRRRIFEPFYTTKGPGKGTGLGLSTVFGIVEHHNGFIDVRSVVGKGTSFIVYLPIPERALEELVTVKNDLMEMPTGTETILFIEDEELLRELVKAILISKGYTVLSAEDGKQGVEMYQSHQDRIALVLSDLGLPKLDGREVFRKIREINSKAKIIIASGFFDPEVKLEMNKAGLNNFIQKPYLPDELLQKIREAIDTTK